MEVTAWTEEVLRDGSAWTCASAKVGKKVAGRLASVDTELRASSVPGTGGKPHGLHGGGGGTFSSSPLELSSEASA